MADAALLRRKVGRGGGNSYSLFKARSFGGPGVPASELFGGLRILLSKAAELPLPPSLLPGTGFGGRHFHSFPSSQRFSFQSLDSASLTSLSKNRSG